MKEGTLFDPEGEERAKEMLDGVVWCADAYATMDGADALAILTEWNEFRALSLPRVRGLLKAPIVVDLRNVYTPAMMSAEGFHYTSIGRPAAAPEGPERS